LGLLPGYFNVLCTCIYRLGFNT